MKKQLAKVRHAAVCASLALFILFGATGHAQTFVNKSWVKTTGLPDAIHWTGSSFDSEKNLIFVGNTVTAPGNANILVTKYNTDGNIAWQRITGGPAGLNDYGVAVTVDNQNNSYIAAAMTASNGLFDFAVLKYDAQGTLQWTATWDGNHHLHDLPTAITLDDAGNVIVVGSSISFTQQSNYAVVKYNPAGIQLWATTYDHVGLHDFPTAIEKASNDNIVVTGASSSAPNSWDYATILVNGATGQIENVNRVNVPEIGLDQPLAVARDAQNNLFITGYNEKQGNKNIQTVKLNSNFGLEWVQSYDAGGLEDIAKSIGCDALGNVYVAGHSKTTQEGTTFIVLKYDTQGNLLWNQTYKPYTHDGAQAADIRVMPTGDFYLSGTIQKGSESDFATLKYNKDGQIEWEKRFDGSGTDEVTTIKADNNGNVYVSGISEDISGKKYSTIKYSSQKNIQTIIYRADGSPSHIADELILKLSHAAVNHEFVNDGDRVYGTAEEILSNNAITQMESVLPFNIKNNPEVQFSKIFTSMKTSDTISISRLGSRIPIPAFWSTLLMKIPEGFDMQTIENQLNTLFPLVEYNHFNFLGIPESFPNDSLITGRNVRQTSLRPEGLDTTAHINVDSAWNVTTGKNYIKVGVYDYPVYWKHPDFGGTTFQNSVVKGGFDYVNSVHISLASTPVNSHGTNCAGIIGAMRNNQIGIAGIAGGNHVLRDTGVSLYSFGIFKNDSTAATTQTIANAIYEGASSTYYGLQLQNHSWSMPSAPEALRKSIKFAYANNCILVASRGNNGVFEPRYPACFKDEWVLNIGAAGNDGHFKTQQNGFIDNDWQSSYGHNVDIIAPGSADNIYTTNGPTHSNRCGSSPDEYACFRGTSAAAPHVSGSIALMLSLHNTRRGYPNNLSPEDVEKILETYSKPVRGTAQIDSFAYNPVLGYQAVPGTQRTVSFATGYNLYNGWGFLNIGASIRMINAPRYKILHPVQTPTMNKAQVRTLPVLYLFDSINTTIPSGRYTNVTQWRVTERYAHTFSNTKIIDAWKRESSSKGLTEVLNDTLTSDPFTSITFVFNPTRNGVTVNAESFYYRLSDGRWIPNDPDISNKFAYSLHLEDLNFTNTKEVMNSNDDFKVFPNPTDNTMNISCQLDYLPSTLRIDIFDATGRMIHHQILPPLETTLTTIDSKDWVKGAYLVRLTADGRAFYKKIIKI